MILSLTDPVRSMPRCAFGPDGAVVRAAPIVDVWPAVPGLSTLPLVVVQVEGERHAIQVPPSLIEALAEREPDAHLVVNAVGLMSWARRGQLRKPE